MGTASHLGTLAVASLFYRSRQRLPESPVRLLVLIPAHDEERVIGDCLAAVARERRESDLVMVVADRCTDATAAIARTHGADVLERGPESEAGRAAARQAGLEHARGLEWDAVLMLDADSIVEPGFFAACERALSDGAVAVQARSESSPGTTLASEAAVAAFTLQGITIPRGRDRLGLSVRLRGTGMAIRRDHALRHRFRAPASEDLFFTLDLMLEGVRCRHVDAARVVSRGESSWGGFGGQKVRYEAGRMAAARAYTPLLIARGIRKREPACLEAAWFLLTPPFALATLSVGLGLAGMAIAGAWPGVAVFGIAAGALGFALVVGLLQARVGPRTWLALVAAPWYVAWKAVVQLRALGRVLRREQHFGPTARV